MIRDDKEIIEILEKRAKKSEAILDKIRAKIEQSRYGLASDGLDLALNIIDECIAESEAEE